MHRRYFLKTIGLGIYAAAAGPLNLITAQPEKRPNIVLMIGDDISVDDHGVYGHPTIQTPHIDQLAANGLRLNNAYLTSPQCSPTRCSIMTGRYPHNTGAPELHMPLPEGQTMFVKLLKNSGYYTAAAGKWHLGYYAREAFDHIDEGGGPSGAEHWVQTLQGRPKDKPFLIWFASHDAHRDWDQSGRAKPVDPANAVVPPYQVDTPKTRHDVACYMGELQRLDSYIGDVAAELQKQGVLDNTLLIYMSDNGRPFPRDKAWLYDSGIKTPFVVHWPERLKKTDTVSNALVSTIDIAPTLLEAAGLEIPPTVQGVSFLSLFENPQAAIRDYAFAELNWHTQFAHMRAVRWKNYVYIRNAAPALSNMMMAKIDRRYASWTELLRVRREERLTPAQSNVLLCPRPEEELYDTANDPHQLTNLVDMPKHRDALEHLRRILDRWTVQTGDTVPDADLRTPDRYDRDTGEPTGVPFNPLRRDWAGKARNAEAINVPGPCREPSEDLFG